MALLLDISGGAGIKYVAFAFAFSLAVYKFLVHGFNKRWVPELVFISYVFLSGLVSIGFGTPIGHVWNEISFLSSFLLIGLLYRLNPTSLIKIYAQFAVLGSILVLMLFLLILFYPAVGLGLSAAGHELGMGYLGYRPGFTELPNVYFRWSIWLVLWLSLSLAARFWKLSFLVGMACFLTMSTAIILMTLLVLISHAILSENRFRFFLVIFFHCCPVNC